MILLLLLADTIDQSRAFQSPPAKAVVRIERATTASRDSWSQRPIPERREVKRVDESGRKIVLRLIEHQ
jgi:hypothetical protein